MKIKFLMAGLFGFISATTFAQKSELKTAQSEFDKYETMRGSAAMATMANTSLTNAKTSIDKAAANEQTATLPQTYALQGAIYSSLAVKDTTAASQPLFTTAAEALKKAQAADTKKEYEKLIKNANLNLAQVSLNQGVRYYQGQKYADAYKAFDYYRTVLPEDTNAIYYSALSAYNAQNFPAAISNYSKLVTTNYSKKASAYSELTNAYLNNKDTTGALKVISDALVKYPNSADLRRTEIEINLQQGKQKEVIDKTLAAINNDPKNKSLYYYAGLAYSGAAEAIKPATGKDAAAKAALVKSQDENFAKAAEMYKKAIELDPSYYEANLNAGYVLMAPAITMYNAANKLTATAAYNAAMVKVNAQVDKAKPYLDKALESHPDSQVALSNLKNYYIIKKDNAHVAEMTKRLATAK
ncbi:tetratricopeptide repeat protein [Mucilaginibacter koreensis]